MRMEGRLTAVVFIGFLKRLLHDADHPVFPIVDGHPVHRSTKVKRFVTARTGSISFSFYTPYSPELNPDELVWNRLKPSSRGQDLDYGP